MSAPIQGHAVGGSEIGLQTCPTAPVDAQTGTHASAVGQSRSTTQRTGQVWLTSPSGRHTRVVMPVDEHTVVHRSVLGQSVSETHTAVDATQ